MGARLVLGIAWLAAMALAAPAMPGAEQSEAPPQPEGVTPPAETVPPPEQAVTPVPQAPAATPDPVKPPTPPPATAAPVSTADPRPTGEDPPKPVEATQQREKAADGAPRAFAAAPGSVTIKDFSFTPSSVTVGVGESVTWNNTGPSEHTATATDGSFDTGLLGRGESGSATFSRAGTFSYICTPHPFMKGTVRVVAQTGGAGETGTGSGVGSAAEGGTTSTDSSGQAASLPSTGSDPLWLAISGLGLLLIGSIGRRRTLHG